MTWTELADWLDAQEQKLPPFRDVRSLAPDLESVLPEWHRIDAATRGTIGAVIRALASTRQLPRLTEDETWALSWRLNAACSFALFAAENPAMFGDSPAPNPAADDPGAAAIEWMLTTFWDSHARHGIVGLLEILLLDDMPDEPPTNDQRN